MARRIVYPCGCASCGDIEYPCEYHNGKVSGTVALPFNAGPMNLRDYFAACFVTAQFLNEDADSLAKKAYDVADAMLKQREVSHG
jgi:hypothetical protein